MRVACIQFTPEFGRVKQNRARLIDRLMESEADLLVLPELSLSGYRIRDPREAEALSEPADGPTARDLRALCRARGCHVVVGLAEQADGRLYNSAILVGPEGLVGTYRKTHLFGDEPDWCEPGDTGFRVWDVSGCRVGIMICFDWVFPESARSLALAGADLIAHPANLVLPYCQRSMPVRALENGVFSATANRCGSESRGGMELSFTGGSLIVGPGGELLARASPGSDEVIAAEIDPLRARDKHLTRRNHLLSDRRPELYRI